MSLDVDGTKLKVIPRDVAYNVISDEPIHIDFMRVVPGTKIILEIPVKFINDDDCPGLKVGGVLNIVRRKVELRCPADNIPEEIIVDLKGLEIGTSIKISSVKLPENVTPTIVDRDFVIATVAAPTVLKEPEKPAEGEVLKVLRVLKVLKVLQRQELKVLHLRQELVKKVILLKKMIKQKVKNKLQKKNSLKRNN